MRDLLTRWLGNLERRAAKAQCTVPTAQFADRLPPSPPAQPVDMPVAAPLVWFGLWF